MHVIEISFIYSSVIFLVLVKESVSCTLAPQLGIFHWDGAFKVGVVFRAGIGGVLL